MPKTCQTNSRILFLTWLQRFAVPALLVVSATRHVAAEESFTLTTVRSTAVDGVLDGLHRDLVLHYPFDNDDDGEVYDESDNGNGGALVGDVRYEASFRGRAARFTSSRTYIQSDAPGLNMHGWRQLSVSVWIYTSRLTTYGRILNRGAVAGDQHSGISLQVGSGTSKASFGMMRQFSSNPPVQETLYTSTLMPKNRNRVGEWVHMVATFDGRFMRLYIDGELDRQAEVSSDGLKIWDRADHKLVIGNSSIRSRMRWSDKYFDGLVDEVRIWKRCLTPEEVAALHGFDARPIEVAHRAEDRPSGSTDNSGRGHAATDPNSEFVLYSNFDEVDLVTEAGDQQVLAGKTQELYYNPRGGTQPTEVGFRLLDNDRGHAGPSVKDGVLSQGPTTRKGYQRWYTHKVPFDFSEGGVAVEWIAKVNRSTIHQVSSEGKLWAGWGVQLSDSHRRAFDIYLAEDQVMLNRDDGNYPVKLHKFDTTDQFHHYRFVVDDSQGMLFIDHDPTPVFMAEIGVPEQPRWASANELGFGDCTTNASCDVQLRSIFISNDSRATPRQAAANSSISAGGAVQLSIP